MSFGVAWQRSMGRQCLHQLDDLSTRSLVELVPLRDNHGLFQHEFLESLVRSCKIDPKTQLAGPPHAAVHQLLFAGFMQLEGMGTIGEPAVHAPSARTRRCGEHLDVPTGGFSHAGVGTTHRHPLPKSGGPVFRMEAEARKCPSPSMSTCALFGTLEGPKEVALVNVRCRKFFSPQRTL